MSWVSIAKELPRKQETIFFHVKGKKSFDIGRFGYDGVFVQEKKGTRYLRTKVDYWHPFPEMPRELYGKSV